MDLQFMNQSVQASLQRSRGLESRIPPAPQPAYSNEERYGRHHWTLHYIPPRFEDLTKLGSSFWNPAPIQRADSFIYNAGRDEICKRVANDMWGIQTRLARWDDSDVHQWWSRRPPWNESPPSNIAESFMQLPIIVRTRPVTWEDQKIQERSGNEPFLQPPQNPETPSTNSEQAVVETPATTDNNEVPVTDDGIVADDENDWETINPDSSEVERPDTPDGNEAYLGDDRLSDGPEVGREEVDLARPTESQLQLAQPAHTLHGPSSESRCTGPISRRWSSDLGTPNRTLAFGANCLQRHPKYFSHMV